MRLTLACFLVLTNGVSAFTFTPSATKAAVAAATNTHAASTTLLQAQKEDVARKELDLKSTMVEAKDEIKYGSTVSGEGAEGETKISTTDSASDEPASSSFASAIEEKTKKFERLTKPRAYPLFLAEKGAIIVEDIVKGITTDKNKPMTTYETFQRDQAGIVKEKIVILGTGWGSAAFLKDIDTNMYDVTVVSPRNFFLFTPMLAGASVGTVEFRSITESIRQINLNANYLEGTATTIDAKTKTISCESVVCEGNSCSIEDFTVEYDKVIVAVGAQTNTFGIPGVREHCCFLKQVDDARTIRTSLVNCFERANLPNLDEEQKKSILTFAVIGAGPTGVEFASELRDFVEQDGYKYYPELLKFVRIKVIEASPTVLAPFDKSLQEEAIKQLTRDVSTKDPNVLNLLPEKFKLTELLLNAGVAEVKEDEISLNDGTEIPYGLAVWAAGNGPLPVTLELIESLGSEGEQADAQAVARGRIAVDPWLRVLSGDGSMFAYGDCTCMINGQLPATAQVASQQGEFLARLFSQGYDMSPGMDPIDDTLLPPQPDPSRQKSLSENIAAFACQNDEVAAPFQFLNLGILAYTGAGSALAQLQLTPAENAKVKGKGKIGFGLWRSVYLSKQVSWRNRFLVFVDWSKTQIFGRDITRL